MDLLLHPSFFTALLIFAPPLPQWMQKNIKKNISILPSYISPKIFLQSDPFAVFDFALSFSLMKRHPPRSQKKKCKISVHYWCKACASESNIKILHNRNLASSIPSWKSRAKQSTTCTKGKHIFVAKVSATLEALVEDCMILYGAVVNVSSEQKRNVNDRAVMSCQRPFLRCNHE